ncbi:MAG: VWA domain-containing protein, partial [Lentisphaerae bacterium]
MNWFKVMQPAAWWLSLLIPLLILLYFLKLRRPQKIVSSTLLWQRLLQDQRVNALFQRLRRQLLLILQLMVLILLVLAALRPWRMGTQHVKTQRLLLVVDLSASMGYREADGLTRLKRAQEAMLSLLSTCSDDTMVALLGFHEKAWFVQGFTRNIRRLRKTIRELEPMAARSNLSPVIKVINSLGGIRNETVIHLFSDGAFPTSEVVSKNTVPIVFHQVGQSSDNAGIRGISVRRQIAQPELVDILINLHN